MYRTVSLIINAAKHSATYVVATRWHPVSVVRRLDTIALELHVPIAIESYLLPRPVSV
jgi:hypothetical protein